jgi:phosphoglucomutase
MVGKEIDETSVVKNLSVYQIIEKQHNLCIVILRFTERIDLPEFSRDLDSAMCMWWMNRQRMAIFLQLLTQSGRKRNHVRIEPGRSMDILLGTDRCRPGRNPIKNDRGEWVLMNGSQTAVLTFNYLIEARKEKDCPIRIWLLAHCNHRHDR